MSHLNKNSQAPNQKVRFREFNPSIFCNHTKTSDIYIYLYLYIYIYLYLSIYIYMHLLKEEVTVEIRRYIRSIFGHLRKRTTIKSAFLTKKHLWFNFHKSGPSFTFQYFFLNQFQANFFFLYTLKGTIQQLRNAIFLT